MGSLTKPHHLMVVIYLFLKFVVPNIPGSAPLALQSDLSVSHVDHVGYRHLSHDERRVKGRLLGADSAILDRREHRRDCRAPDTGC